MFTTPSHSDDLVYLNYINKQAETKDAALYVVNDISGNRKKVWIPKSQIKVDKDGILAIPNWLAKKNKLGSDW